MTNAQVCQGFHDDKKVEENCSRSCTYGIEIFTYVFVGQFYEQIVALIHNRS